MVLGELEIRSGVENLDEGIDKEVSDDFADVRECPVGTNPTNKSRHFNGLIYQRLDIFYLFSCLSSPKGPWREKPYYNKSPCKKVPVYQFLRHR